MWEIVLRCSRLLAEVFPFLAFVVRQAVAPLLRFMHNIAGYNTDNKQTSEELMWNRKKKKCYTALNIQNNLIIYLC